MSGIFDQVADQVELAGARHRFYDDPVGFCEQCIRWPAGESLTAYQRELLAAVPERRKVSARGPHGLGKTTTAALLMLWFAVTRELSGVDWKAVTTAGSWRQLERFLWPEILLWARRLRWDVIGAPAWSERTELLSLNIKLRHGSAFAVASDNPSLIEGAHAASLLYVFDEAKAISAETFDAAEGAFSGAGENGLEAFALASSTPGEPVGRFYDLHARKSGLEDWWVRHVTAEEAVAAGRVSQSWIDQRRRQWGRDSALYANRVLGEFHASESDGVIPLGWVELATERWRAWDAGGRLVVPGRRTVGVDVARSGSDKTVMAIFDEPVITEVRRSSREDTMQTTGRVMGILAAEPGRVPVVDVIGVGGGVVDRLRELRQTVVAFNASAATDLKDRSGELGFLNARAAAWWRLRELLDPSFEPVLALPPNDRLIGDLTAPHWRVTSTGRIQIESKDDIRKRIGRSTDAGDAVVQALWVGGRTSFADAIALMRLHLEAAEKSRVAAEGAARVAPAKGDAVAARRAARNASARRLTGFR